MMQRLVITISVAIVLAWAPATIRAQHVWQKPKRLVSLDHVSKIIGPVDSKTPSKPLHILWVWGYDKHHRPGTHDYLKVRDLFVGLLSKVPKVTVEPVYAFPSQSQFDKADLVVFYLHLPDLSDEQYESFGEFIRRGGGVVALHESAIMRPTARGKKLAQCLGMAWDEGRSQWGAIFEDVTIKTEHKILAGFPNKLRVVDEFYWQLNRRNDIEVLGRVRTGPPGRSKGPLPGSRLSKEASPVFWTLEAGNGRVFGTTLGHNTFSYYDPELRIIILRAMAWAVKEIPDPFMPLVTDGITNRAGMVGTTDSMRNWQDKLREPPGEEAKP